MTLLKDILCCIFVVSPMITSAYGVRCYFCNSTIEHDACGRGFPNISTTDCVTGEVCAAYQYDVFLNDKPIGTGTSRGCEKNENYCGLVEDMINILVQPAVVKQKICYICQEDFCNNSPIANLSYFILISVLLIDLNSFFNFF